MADDNPWDPKTNPLVVSKPDKVTPGAELSPHDAGVAGRAGPGCLTALIVMMLLLGWIAYSSTGSNTALGAPLPTSSASPQNSALPLITPSDSTGATAPAVTSPSPTPTDQTSTTAPTDQTSTSTTNSQAPSQQAPSQQAAPPPPSCSYPSSIDVSGGSPGGLSGSGGSFTVTGSPVVMSAQLAYCGPHYKLAWSASGPQGAGTGTASGEDCQKQSFNTDISGNVQQGWSVSVQLILPPNSCGS